MLAHIRIFGPILILWILCYLLQQVCRKTAFPALEKNFTDKESKEFTELDASHKHINRNCIAFMVTIIISAVVPLTELRWILFFFCAMISCPVLYDILYVTVKNAFKSKENMLLALPAIFDMVLIVITLFLHYFAYMHKDFS